MKTVHNLKKALCLLLSLFMLAALFVPATVVVNATETNVAMVTKEGDTEGTSYTTFEAAWQAIKDHRTEDTRYTLTLLADVTLNTPLSMPKNNFTIDGDGYTISNTSAVTDNTLFTLAGIGIEIKDLTVDACTSQIDTVLFNLVTVPALSLNETAATMSNVKAETWKQDAIQLRTGTLTLNDCTVYTEGNSCIMSRYEGDNNIIINGGYYSRGTDAKTDVYSLIMINNDAGYKRTVTITDATFVDYNAPSIRTFNVSATIDCTVKVYGGTFINRNASFVNSSNYNLAITGTHFVSTLDGTDSALDAGNGNLTTEAVNFSALQKGGVVTDANVEGQYLAPNGKTYFTTQNTIDLLDGASVRLVEGSSGIRFSSVVTKATIDAIDAIKDAGTEISYGTVIVPTDYIQGNAGMPTLTKGLLAKAGKEYIDIKATSAGIVEDADGNVTINAAMIDIKETNYDRDFSAVSYIEFVKDGKTVTVYAAYNETDNSRSIQEVAQKALADDTVTYTPEQEAILNGYVAAAQNP